MTKTDKRKGPPPSARKPHLAADLFVRAWQSSETWEAFLKASGISEGSARMRANNYRKKGIPLKRYPGQSFDVDALAKLARELAPPGSISDPEEEVIESARSIRPPVPPARPPDGRRDIIAKRATAPGEFPPRPLPKDED